MPFCWFFHEVAHLSHEFNPGIASEPQPSHLTFKFRGDWLWNNFCGHSLHTFDSSKAVVSYWHKYVHLGLINPLGGLILSRNSESRLTDRLGMTLLVLIGLSICFYEAMWKTSPKCAMPWENLFYTICEQQRCRSVCSSAQSDQRHCCFLFRYCSTYSC